MAYPRYDVMQHVVSYENILLGVGRQGLAVNDPIWNLVTVSNKLVDRNIFRRGGISLFPLYLCDKSVPLFQINKIESNNIKTHNFTSEFLNLLEGFLNRPFFLGTSDKLSYESFNEQEVFHYIFALLHSTTYRKRYSEFLSIDFPRRPTYI